MYQAVLINSTDNKFPWASSYTSLQIWNQIKAGISEVGNESFHIQAKELKASSEKAAFPLVVIYMTCNCWFSFAHLQSKLRRTSVVIMVTGESEGAKVQVSLPRCWGRGGRYKTAHHWMLFVSLSKAELVLSSSLFAVVLYRASYSLLYSVSEVRKLTVQAPVPSA